MVVETKELVSVVVPAYNARDHIMEALKSIMAQTYRPIEVIVVDDGSIDTTVDDVFNYLHLYKKQEENAGENFWFNIFRQSNKGPSAARNRGMTESLGEYVAFLDADDCWEPNKIAQQVELLRSQPEMDIVVTNARIIRKIGNHEEDFTLYEKESLGMTFFGHKNRVISPFKKLLQINFIPTSSLLARKLCFLEGCRFNEGRRHVEDLELWLKLARQYKFGYLKEAFVIKEEHGGGLSANKDKMIVSKMDVLGTALSDQKDQWPDGLTEKWVRNYLKLSYKWTGYYFLKRGDNKAALLYFISSLRKGIELKTFLYAVLSVVKVLVAQASICRQGVTSATDGETAL